MSVEVSIKLEPCPESPEENAGGKSVWSADRPKIETEFVNIKIEPDVDKRISAGLAPKQIKQLLREASWGAPKNLWIRPRAHRRGLLNLALNSIKQELPGHVPSITVKLEPLDENETENLHYVEICPTVVKTEPADDIVCPPLAPSENWCQSLSPKTILPDLSDAEYLGSTPIEQTDGLFICPICKKKFVTKGNVQRHLSLHDRETYKCPYCTREYSNRKFYEKHIYLHSLEKKFGCDKCRKTFRTSSNLEQHKKSHLEVKPYICDVCERPFSIRGNMLKHKTRHNCKKSNTEPFTCDVCNKVFLKEYLLKSHLTRHTSEKPFHCDICMLNFKHKSTLIRHIQVHKGLMPFSCKICLKRFTHKGLLKPHMRKHTGEKPYQCRMCKKLFSHKHNMLRHEQRHSKVKNLVCHICSKAFPRESRLKYHMRSHTKEKLFSCDVCFRDFSHKQNVIRHYDRKHPNVAYGVTKREIKIEEVE